MENKVVVIDFGSKFNTDICRKVRKLGIYCEQIDYLTKAEELARDQTIKAIILSGSPKSIYKEDAYRMDQAIYDLNIPILGICYGMQTLAYDLGGDVQKMPGYIKGDSEVTIFADSPLTEGLKAKELMAMDHGDEVTKIPEGFSLCASDPTCKNVIMVDSTRNFYGVQFHPEITENEAGNKILTNFLYNICKIKPDWTMKDFMNAQVDIIKNEVQDEKVLCALSGGVDSAVVAALLFKAIGDKLICMHIDHGLLRADEADSVVEVFEEQFGVNLIKIDAQDRFLSELKGITDPEEKRKIIGRVFIEVFTEECQKISDIKYLAQGTIYPDILESGTSSTKAVKAHHNVGGLPEDLNFKLVEPLKNLFKDEVRELGKELGLSDKFVKRQPFPGPGLGVRVLGELTKEKLNLLRAADLIVREEIEAAAIKEAWQYFAILPGISSTGNRNNQRSCEQVIAIRVVSTIDAITADWVRVPYEVLDRISRRIVSEVKDVNRVVYDITSKPPSTIEWE